MKNIFKLVKNILFPVYCVKCKKEGEWFCDECKKQEKISLVLRCPKCNKKNNGELCLGCKDFSSLDKVVALFNFSEKKHLATLVHSFKYQYALEIKKIWQEMIQDFFALKLIPLDFFENSILVPIPLHWARKRERGFNQAEIIATLLAKELTKLGVTFYQENSLLKRIKRTKQQALLVKELREKNIKDSFILNKNILLPSNKVILVDDVFTSGATLMEAGKVLKSANVEMVQGFCLARGKWD